MRRTPQRFESDVAALVREVSRRTGLDFAGCHRDRMIGVLIRMSSDAGAGTVSDYLRLLDHEPDAYEALVDRLTIGETYFFRDPAQLEVIRRLVRGWRSADPVARGPRLWSAGCATGEEPYTFAMMLAEEGVLEGASIVGTDLSERALERARAATYGRWSLRRCDARQQAVHFTAVGDRFRPRTPYLDAVALRLLSLLEGPPAKAHFDIVCCRNVLMYLTGAAQEQALCHLRDALVPGGWLFLGPSDRVVELDGLACRSTGAGIAYQRSAPTVAPGPAPPAAPESRPPAASRPAVVPGLPAGQGAAGIVVASRLAPQKAVEAAVIDVAADDDEDEDDVASTIRALAASGDTEGAWRLLDAAIAGDPVDAELRYLAAMLHLHAGRPDEAVRSGVAAVYLDPSLAVAHLVLGQAEQLSGNEGRARRSYLNALELLSAMPPDAPVRHGAGEPAGRLAAAAAALAGG